MFEDDDIDDHGGAAHVDVGQAPASYRQQNAENARQVRQHMIGSRPRHPELDANKVKAAQELSAQGLCMSLRAFSRKHDVDFAWARRLLMIAGSVVLDEQREGFRRLSHGGVPTTKRRVSVAGTL